MSGPSSRSPLPWLTSLVAAGFFLLGAGCGSTTNRIISKATVARPLIVVGEVALVDEKKHFVLVDLQSNLYVPPPGAALRARSATGETAWLRAGPEQHRPFIVADILDGRPAVGDLVME